MFLILHAFFHSFLNTPPVTRICVLTTMRLNHKLFIVLRGETRCQGFIAGYTPQTIKDRVCCDVEGLRMYDCLHEFFFFNGQDFHVRYDQIKPLVAWEGRPQFPASPDHGSVFIPQTMVELDVQVETTSILSTKDTLKEIGVDHEGRRQTCLKFQTEKEALPHDFHIRSTISCCTSSR